MEIKDATAEIRGLKKSLITLDGKEPDMSASCLSKENNFLDRMIIGTVKFGWIIPSEYGFENVSHKLIPFAKY